MCEILVLLFIVHFHIFRKLRIRAKLYRAQNVFFLSPIRLTLMSVCIKNTFLCLYVKCPFCCQILNKIWACEGILDTIFLLPGRMKHSQPCELLYWCFCWICPTTSVIIQIWQIRWPVQPNMYVLFCHISRADLLITRNKYFRIKVVEKMKHAFTSRICLSTFPFLGNYTEWTLPLAFRTCSHHN